MSDEYDQLRGAAPLPPAGCPAPIFYAEQLGYVVVTEMDDLLEVFNDPETDDEMLKEWCGDRKAFSRGQPTPEDSEAIAHRMLSYWRYAASSPPPSATTGPTTSRPNCWQPTMPTQPN